MSIDRILKKAKAFKRKETIYIIVILSLALLLKYSPHISYPYLLHVDEWFHIAEAKQIVLGSEINWYTGEPFSLGMERAWHMMLAIIYFLFKPSIPQWTVLPAIFHVLAVVVVYYFVSKLYNVKSGVVSALLVAILPSNVTMGGPVFLIPLNLSLILIPLALLFAFRLVHLKDRYNYLALFLIATFTLYAHPPTAVVLFLLLGIYFLLSIISKKRESTKPAFYLLITLLLSLLASIPNYLSILQQKGLESISFDFWVYLQGIPFIYGIIPTIFFVIGFYYLSKSERKETWCLLFTSVLLMVNVLFFSWFGLSYILPYQRTHIPLFLLMAIIGSQGYMKLLDVKKPDPRIGTTILVILLLATTGLAINSQMNTSYYHLIDEHDYDSFHWIKDNTPQDAIVLSDPLKARALAPVAERQVYAVMPFGPVEKELARVANATRFFNENCTNTMFLIENNISVVYTRGSCDNPFLVEVKEDIFLFNYNEK
jgi:asparagine N-glycosylation enzyme membrane subunit Stt3